MKKIRYLVLPMLLSGVLAISAFAAYYEWPANGSIVEMKTIDITTTKSAPVSFHCEDLEFRLGLAQGELQGLAITTLPPVEAGELFLQDKRVTAYQELTRDEINQLSFVPTETAEIATIAFIPKATHAITTNLKINFSQQVNSAPTIESETYHTVKDVRIQGQFRVTDPDEDAVRIELKTNPKKGQVVVSQTAFTYQPYPGETGEDWFSFVCIDKVGNYSREGVIRIMIDNNASNFAYTDMASHSSHYAAIQLHEKGIMTGLKVGTAYLFQPSSVTTRGEFLTMLISAAGLEDKLTPCVNTNLANDNEIPMWLKPYVKLGISEKIIKEDHFYPNEVPMRCEAVVMVDRVSKIPNVKRIPLQIDDMTEVPIWAIQSYMNLSAYKMLDLYSTCAYPQKALTRSDSADLIWQLWKHIND